MTTRTVRLPHEAPCDWRGVLAFLAHRAVAGVEQVDSGVYRRTIQYGGLTGTFDVARDETGSALIVTVRGPAAAEAPAVAHRVRRMFDLEVDLRPISAHLARDPWMAPLLAARPVHRVFRGWDGFEVAARSVIGQQVSVARARHLNGVLAERCGSEVPGAARDGLHRLFPTSHQVLDADLASMGMPGARVTTLKTVAAAAIADPQLFERARSIEEAVERLRAIRGIGDWTAHYIAMRACGEPDAFPASDVGLLRGAAEALGRRPAAAELLARAEAWRPWRAYAAHVLWAVDSTVRDRVSGAAERRIASGRPVAGSRRTATRRAQRL